MNKKHMLVAILTAASGLIPLMSQGATPTPVTSVNVPLPTTIPQTQKVTTTGAQNKTITPFVNAQPIPNQTCPSGYALTQVGYIPAYFTTMVCSATERYASGCDHGCNAFCSPFTGLCCEGAPGFHLQDNDSCTEYSNRCVAWRQVWTPSSNILENNSVAYMAGSYVCHQIINVWTKYVPPSP